MNIANGQNLLRIGKHLFQQKDLLHIHKRAKRIISWRKIVALKTLEFLPWILVHQVQKRTEPKIGSITQKETAAVTFYGLVLEDGSLEELEVQEAVLGSPDDSDKVFTYFRESSEMFRLQTASH